MSTPIGGPVTGFVPGSPIPAPTTTPQTTTPDTPGTPPPSTYLNLPFARLTVGLVGLDLPRTPEDAAAILADAALALDRTEDEARKLGSEARASSMRTGLADLAARFEAIRELAVHYAETEATRDEKKTEKDDKTAERDNKQARSNFLGSEISRLQGVENHWAAERDRLLAAAGATADPALKAVLLGQAGAAESNRASAASQRATYQAEKNTVDGQIQTLNGEIATLQAEITALEAEMAATLAAYGDAQVVLLFTFAQLAIAVAQRTRADMDVGEMRDDTIFREFEDLNANLKEVGMMGLLREVGAALLDELEDPNARDRVVQAAAALLLALGDLFGTIRAQDDAFINPQDSVLDPADRVRLAL